MKQLVCVFLLFPLLICGQSNFEKAEKLFKEEKYDQARSVFESILKSNPSNLKAIEYLGDISSYFKSWDKSIVYYKRLKFAKPSEANYYFKYGVAMAMKAREINKFRALGMIGEIRSSFEKAIALNPKHINARWALVELYLQLPNFVGGSETKAIKYSNELLLISPVDGYLSRGHIEEYFKRYESAELQYKKAIAIGGSKISYEKLVNLYKTKMKNPEKAKAVFSGM